MLGDEDRARADEILAGLAGPLTFGQLRSKAHRLVLKLDPDAARKRKEQAKQDAHVRRFREDSGNAGMIDGELPPDEVLASWQHVEQRALDLRAAGMGGTLTELRVRAYLDLLQERDSRLVPAGQGPDRKDTGPAGQPDPGGTADDGPGGAGGPGPGPGGGPGGTGPQGHPGRARQGAGPSVAALVNILVPVETLLGLSAAPGEAAGYGLLDAADARDLVAAAARHPHTRWCVTALHPDGTAAAHGCARGRHPPPPAPGPAGPAGTRGDPSDPDPPPGNPRLTNTGRVPGPDPPAGPATGGSPPGPDPPPGTGARD